MKKESQKEKEKKGRGVSLSDRDLDLSVSDRSAADRTVTICSYLFSLLNSFTSEQANQDDSRGASIPHFLNQSPTTDKLSGPEVIAHRNVNILSSSTLMTNKSTACLQHFMPEAQISLDTLLAEVSNHLVALCRPLGHISCICLCSNEGAGIGKSTSGSSCWQGRKSTTSKSRKNQPLTTTENVWTSKVYFAN